MVKRAAVAVLTILLLVFAVASGTASASPSQQAGQSLTVERSEDRLSATATWTPSQGAENQFFIYVGKLLLGEADAYGIGLHFDSYRELQLTGDEDSLDISGLDPSREYIYAVARADMGSDGKWVWSDWDIVGNILPPPGSASMDRDALVALYNATDGANWRENANWLSDAPVGEWHGVETDSDGRVIEVSLWLNNLNGELPSELGGLAKLERLNLPLNRLNGEIPSGLGSLSSLEELILIGNALSGEIPVELGGLLNLEKLYLSVGSQFTGCIPSALRNVADNDLSELGLEFCD